MDAEQNNTSYLVVENEGFQFLKDWKVIPLYGPGSVKLLLLRLQLTMTVHFVLSVRREQSFQRAERKGDVSHQNNSYVYPCRF